MKFSTREDLDVSQEQAFAQITNFPLLERMAMRRGATVTRHREGGENGEGMQWDVDFRFRGKPRSLRITMAAVTPPRELCAQSEMTGLDATFEVSLVPLAPARTRMIVALEMRPKSMPARLLLQSMKLAKGTLTQKFKTRVTEFSRGIEERVKAGQAGGA